MYIQTFEEKLFANVGSNLKHKRVKEWQQLRYRFEDGTIVKAKSVDGKVINIKVKGPNEEKISEIFKKPPKNI